MRDFSSIYLYRSISKLSGWSESELKTEKVATTSQTEMFTPKTSSDNTNSITFGNPIIIESDSKFFPYNINKEYYFPEYLLVYGNYKLLFKRDILRIGVTGSRKPALRTVDTIKDSVSIARERLKVEPMYIIGGAIGVDSIVIEEVMRIGGLLAIIVPKIAERFLSLVSQSERIICITIYPNLVPLYSWMFLRRNWIIGGMSNLLWFFQGGIRSGSMSCSNYSVKLGKTVYVNDRYSPSDKRFSGNSKLLSLGYCSLDSYLQKLDI